MQTADEFLILIRGPWGPNCPHQAQQNNIIRDSRKTRSSSYPHYPTCKTCACDDVRHPNWEQQNLCVIENDAGKRFSIISTGIAALIPWWFILAWLIL